MQPEYCIEWISKNVLDTAADTCQSGAPGRRSIFGSPFFCVSED